MKLVAATLLLSIPASALAAEPPCELHVWPSNATGAVTAGVLSNLGVLGAYADMRSNRDATMRDQVALIQTLTPVQQAQAVIATDLPHLLGLGQVRLVLRSENLDRRISLKQQARLTDSTAPCYAELFVSLNEYRNSAARGRSLKTEFSYRDFRGSKPRITIAAEASALRHFPADSPDKETEAAKDVTAAFAANLRSFAQRVTRRSR